MTILPSRLFGLHSVSSVQWLRNLSSMAPMCVSSKTTRHGYRHFAQWFPWWHCHVALLAIFPGCISIGCTTPFSKVWVLLHEAKVEFWSDCLLVLAQAPLVSPEPQRFTFDIIQPGVSRDLIYMEAVPAPCAGSREIGPRLGAKSALSLNNPF